MVTGAARGPAGGLSRGALAGIALASALVPLGSTMAAVALVEIAGDLDATTGAATWLVTGYLAAMAVVQPLGGRLGDRHGHRRVFLAGLAGFLALSALAAAAPSLGVLIGLRVAQAAAGGLMLPNAAALILHGVPGPRRGRAFGVLATALALAAAVGPVLGGALVETLGWRTLFLVALPAGLLAAPAVRGAPDAAPSPAAHAHTPARAALAAVLGRPAFVSAASTILLHNAVLYSALVLVPIVAHDRLGLDHGASGALAGALTAGLLAGAVAGGRAADRWGRRAAAVTGGLVAACGAAPLPLLGLDPSVPGLAACLLVTGAGIGLAGPALQAGAVEAAPAGAVAVAGGLYMSARYAGGIAASLVAGAVAGAEAFALGLAVAAAAAALSALTPALLPGGHPPRVLTPERPPATAPPPPGA